MAPIAIDVRPIKPADRVLIADAVAYTSEQSYYRRFHTPMHGFREHELTRLTEIDGEDHLALVATEHDRPERLVAVARFVRSREDPALAEFAIIVHDPYQRRGIGRQMLTLLVAAAREHGITRLTALIQADNVARLGLLHAVLPQAKLESLSDGAATYVAEI